MPDELPKGWVKTTLGEIRRDDSLGISQQQMRGDTFELYSVPAFEERRPEIVRGEEIGSNKATVAPGDVLLCKINPRINRAWVVAAPKGHRQIASTEWIVFSKQEGIAPEYLAYFFNQDRFRNYLSTNVSGVGGSLMRVNARVVGAYSIPLAPAREQERIVVKLDALLSRVAAGEAAARRALERLKRYRAAVLHAAVTGELTHDWRKKRLSTLNSQLETGQQLLKRLLQERRARWEEAELKRLHAAGKPPKDNKWKSRYPEPMPPRTEDLPHLPNGWTWASLDQLSLVVRGASPRPAGDRRYFGGRIPWITVGSLTKDSEPYLTEVSEGLTEAGKDASRFIEKDTLLLTNSGATLGVPKISRISGCINDGVAALLHVDYPLKLYLYYFLTGQTERLRNINQGAAQPNLNTAIIRSVVTAVPPSEEQSAIIRAAERRLSAADRLASTLNRQLDRARAARQSLLREAFAGRLVPQDPNDEPASVLLDRIRATRETEARKPKAKRMPKPKSKLTLRPLLDVLREHKNPMTPEQLFSAAGFEHEFKESKRSQEVVDAFYRELRRLTDSPARIKQVNRSANVVLLEVVP